MPNPDGRWKRGNKADEEIFGNGKCELIAKFSATMVTSPWRERREVWREKRKVRIFGKGKCKLIANCANFWQVKVCSSPILARQWWRHFRLSLSLCIIGSAEALPILCVRCIRWEREIQREKDGSDVTTVALKLAMSFALLLAKNVHLSVGEEFCAFPCQKFAPQFLPRLLNGAEFTLSVAKNVALFETVCILRTVKWRDWQAIEAAKQTIDFPAAPFFFIVEKIEKMNQINTKHYWK